MKKFLPTCLVVLIGCAAFQECGAPLAGTASKPKIALHKQEQKKRQLQPKRGRSAGVRD
ncbi:hypothetical protein FACS189472_11600 [Alphaproteobacteria bacterium]|nr:hypothetical protein FACS189472_11600 [Alphaproteobacteria bacterium]